MTGVRSVASVRSSAPPRGAPARPSTRSAAEEPLEPAEDPGLTLVQFLRGDTLTAHSGAERIVSS